MGSGARALEALGMGNAKALFVAHNDEDYAHVHIVASKINPGDRPRLRPGGQLAHAFDMGASYEREHGGVSSTRRETANELRDAIARPRRRRRARGDDQAAIDLHRDAARPRLRKRYARAERGRRQGSANSSARNCRQDPGPCRHRASGRDGGARRRATRRAPCWRPSAMCCARPRA